MTCVSRLQVVPLGGQPVTCILLAVISNLVYKQRSLQDAVMASGGVELLLSQCQVSLIGNGSFAYMFTAR